LELCVALAAIAGSPCAQKKQAGLQGDKPNLIRAGIACNYECARFLSSKSIVDDVDWLIIKKK
jgi:hypothetical protein